MSKRKPPSVVKLDWYPPRFEDGKMRGGGIGFHMPPCDAAMREWRKTHNVRVLTYQLVPLRKPKRKKAHR